mmetsp:Transcript_57016/g.65736  ORF Transcript_57016/g.65736 Transcript_57016/m.65736 type:complete len:101 (+) Transcript_57016:286-588(+)
MADKERKDNWGWQTKQYKKGEDPIDEWKKRRADGTIGDLEDQYGDPKKIGGIPFPMVCFLCYTRNDPFLVCEMVFILCTFLLIISMLHDISFGFFQFELL